MSKLRRLKKSNNNIRCWNVSGIFSETQFQDVAGQRWQRHNKAHEAKPYGATGALKYRTAGTKTANASSLESYEAKTHSPNTHH